MKLRHFRHNEFFKYDLNTVNKGESEFKAGFDRHGDIRELNVTATVENGYVAIW